MHLRCRCYHPAKTVCGLRGLFGFFFKIFRKRIRKCKFQGIIKKTESHGAIRCPNSKHMAPAEEAPRRLGKRGMVWKRPVHDTGRISSSFARFPSLPKLRLNEWTRSSPSISEAEKGGTNDGRFRVRGRRLSRLAPERKYRLRSQKNNGDRKGISYVRIHNALPSLRGNTGSAGGVEQYGSVLPTLSGKIHRSAKGCRRRCPSNSIVFVKFCKSSVCAAPFRQSPRGDRSCAGCGRLRRRDRLRRRFFLHGGKCCRTEPQRRRIL